MINESTLAPGKPIPKSPGGPAFPLGPLSPCQQRYTWINKWRPIMNENSDYRWPNRQVKTIPSCNLHFSILAPKRSLCEYSLCEIFSELMPEILSYARNQFIFPLHKDIFVRRLGINPRARSLKVVYCMRVIVWHTRQWHEQRPALHASFVGK